YNALGPFHLQENPRETETALVPDLFTLFELNHRVYKRDLAARSPLAAAIHHEQPFEYADLRSGQSHAGRAVHGFEHVIDKLSQFVVELGYFVGSLREDGVPILYDIQNHSMLFKTPFQSSICRRSASFFRRTWFSTFVCSLNLTTSRQATSARPTRIIPTPIKLWVAYPIANPTSIITTRSK